MAEQKGGVTSTRFDFIVVGSGAGGGTLAARLAENGKKVLVLEAGGDPLKMSGADLVEPDVDRLPEDYQTPAFHALSSENMAMKWDFFVDHYSENKERDPKYSSDWSQETEPPKQPDLGTEGNPSLAVGKGKQPGGILYPRAGCLGGCTAHNAMIMVYPHNADWDHIATLTGDPSWSAKHMRSYFELLENCRYRPVLRWLAKLGINPSRHGFKGWLSTELPIPAKALSKDRDLIETAVDSAYEAFKDLGSKFRRFFWQLKGRFDPNDWRLVKDDAFGMRLPPVTTDKHQRIGSRERLVDVQQRFPENLTIELDALATRVLFEGDKAVGVEYLKGRKLYRAHHEPSQEAGERRQAFAHEVILSGGTFNTPQLLMLSGIGPADHLREKGVEVLVDLPGVGSNLQDRYEVGVVNEMTHPWKVLEGATFSRNDPQFIEWKTKRQGVYTTNGALLAVIKRSLEERPLPDLFIFALLGLFRGYYPSYSSLFASHVDYLTWAVLKGHTQNNAGYVRLRSNDPLDTPEIHFKYFEEGNDEAGEDLRSVVEGVKFVREMSVLLKKHGLIKKEQIPGEHIRTDEEIAEWIQNQAWGHHASCSCPIGPRDEGGVVDGDFRVHGVRNLRIVDASVFPKIPGFFIVSSIYMIAEKAANLLLSKSAP